MMMIVAPNSRARKGGKERGEVKGEYGGIWRKEKKGNADLGMDVRLRKLRGEKSDGGLWSRNGQSTLTCLLLNNW